MIKDAIKDAIIDESGMYRYSLTRVWNNNQSKVLFVMLNPSATDPDELKQASDPIGPDNDIHIQRAALQSNKIILAWGTKGSLLGRNKKVMDEVLFSYQTHCLDISKNGHPKHPLYISANREPIIFNHFI